MPLGREHLQYQYPDPRRNPSTPRCGARGRHPSKLNAPPPPPNLKSWIRPWWSPRTQPAPPPPPPPPPPMINSWIRPWEHGHAVRHSISTLNARPIASQFSRHGCMDDLTTERTFDSRVTWVVDVLGLLLDMLSMGVCTIRHWQTSCRLIQELNVCTVWEWKKA